MVIMINVVIISKVSYLFYMQLSISELLFLATSAQYEISFTHGFRDMPGLESEDEIH